MQTGKTGAAFATLVLWAATAQAASTVEQRLATAATALREVMQIPDKSIPQDLLNKAECIVIVPDLKKGAFFFGAKYGRGFLSCRRKSGQGWSAPGAVRIEGGSIGFQVGGSEMDVFMLVMNERGVDRLLSSRFTLGADATAALGPVGRTAEAQTDARMTAEILTWSRARGVFGGVALNGATLREDDVWNQQLYKRSIKNREIVEGNTAIPKAATALLNELDRYSSRR